MNFSGDQSLKLGISMTTTPAAATSTSTTVSNIGGISAPSAFTLPSSTVTAGSTTLQFKSTVPTTPSSATAAANSATTSAPTGFALGGGLLNQLKGHIASNAPSTTLLGSSTSDKKLGVAATSLTTGTSQGATPSLLQTQTTTATTQPAGVTSFLTTPASSDKQASQMTYEELETTVNKLIGKLTDNEEEFSKLSRELNEWDKTINENYDKLLHLTETVKAVKSAQLKLSYDLDFIAIEHKDFESIIANCEKDVENYNFSHPSRHDVYQKAINVDIHVRRMCEELREVIEHLNDRLRFCESDDPVMQIGRVLNAHMESLKWVDESTTQIYDYINYLSQIQEQMKKNPQVGN